jgi:hypothetical protein
MSKIIDSMNPMDMKYELMLFCPPKRNNRPFIPARRTDKKRANDITVVGECPLKNDMTSIPSETKAISIPSIM